MMPSFHAVCPADMTSENTAIEDDSLLGYCATQSSEAVQRFGGSYCLRHQGGGHVL